MLLLTVRLELYLLPVSRANGKKFLGKPALNFSNQVSPQAAKGSV